MPSYDASLYPRRPRGAGWVLSVPKDVTRGRGVPAERLAEVAGPLAVGGVSPIDAQCRELLANVRGAGLDLPMYWGNEGLAAVP